MSLGRGILRGATEGAVMPDALRDPAAERAASIREAVKKYEDQGLDVPKHLTDLAKALPKVKTVAVDTKPDAKAEPKSEPPKATDPKPATTSDPEPETKVADKPVAKVETVEPTGPKPAAAAADPKPVPPPGPASSRVQRK